MPKALEKYCYATFPLTLWPMYCCFSYFSDTICFFIEDMVYLEFSALPMKQSSVVKQQMLSYGAWCKTLISLKRTSINTDYPLQGCGGLVPI